MPDDPAPVPDPDRVRDALAAHPSVREVAMFGGRAFMINDKMAVHVRRSGGLLVRVDPQRSPSLVAEHGARPAEMGAGRSMGAGWLDVPAALLAGDEALRFWIGVALEYNDRATGRRGRARTVADE